MEKNYVWIQIIKNQSSNLYHTLDNTRWFSIQPGNKEEVESLNFQSWGFIFFFLDLEGYKVFVKEITGA